MSEITCIKGSRYAERYEILAYIALQYQATLFLKKKLRSLKLVQGRSLITGTYRLEMQLAKLTIGWDWDA